MVLLVEPLFHTAKTRLSDSRTIFTLLLPHALHPSLKTFSYGRAAVRRKFRPKVLSQKVHRLVPPIVIMCILSAAADSLNALLQAVPSVLNNGIVVSVYTLRSANEMSITVGINISVC